MTVRVLQFFRCAGSLALALAALLHTAAPQAADLHETGPLGLVITYHTTPAHRLALRQQFQESELPQFQRWQDEGVFQSYRILFNRHVDSGAWDAMALLSFARYADLLRWKKIEQAAPAGLSPKALALTTAIDTAPADLVRNGAAAGAGSDTVFLVVPYDVLVPTTDYIAYLDGYVVPQLDGWMGEGALARYGVYLPRYYTGRPWASLLVLEYRSDEALGSREAVVAKVRARLKENREWKAISDSKKKMREEKQAAIADVLTLR
jgi:hypothetical protein